MRLAGENLPYRIKQLAVLFDDDLLEGLLEFRVVAPTLDGLQQDRLYVLSASIRESATV